jgi:hypothetical protein
VSRIYVLLRYMPDYTEENCETYQLMKSVFLARKICGSEALFLHSVCLVIPV